MTLWFELSLTRPTIVTIAKHHGYLMPNNGGFLNIKIEQQMCLPMRGQ